MSDEEYRRWIQCQPSCLTGEFSVWIDGQGRCEAAHVRRAKTSGMGFKAEYACVPLRREEHQHQHDHGELACLVKYLGNGDIPWNRDTARQWFDRQVVKYYQRWLEAR